MKLNPWHPLFRMTPWPTSGVGGSGTANEIAYWTNGTTIGSLTTATYPSLTELSYVKGVTSAIQTQLNAKQAADTDLDTWAGITPGANVGTFLATPSSANLAAAVTGETGTGALVFATSPQLTTSLTTDSTTFALLNATATTINFAAAATTLNIGASATCILNFGGSTTASEFRFLEPSGSGTNYSAFKAVAQAANIIYSLPPAVGAAGTYLKDAAGDGVLTWATAGGSTPTEVIYSTTFETSTRFTNTVTSGGTATYGTNGLLLTTSATGTSGILVKWNNAVSGQSMLAGSPQFSCTLNMGTMGTDFQGKFGIGFNAGTGGALTFTHRFIGFKIIRASSGTASLFATQGDNTTETASAALRTLTANTNEHDLIAKMNGTTSVDYYTREDGGTLSSATNLSTNVPSTAGTASDIFFQLSNAAVATNSTANIHNASYRR